MESTRQNYQCRAINIDIVDLNGFKRLGRVHGKCLSLVNFYDVRMHVIVILILIVIVLNFNDAMYPEIEIILVWSKILKCIVIIGWNTYIVIIQLCKWRRQICATNIRKWWKCKYFCAKIVYLLKNMIFVWTLETHQFH